MASKYRPMRAKKDPANRRVSSIWKLKPLTRKRLVASLAASRFRRLPLLGLRANHHRL